MAPSRDKPVSEKTAKKLAKELKRARRAEKREAEMPYGLEHRRMENLPPSLRPPFPLDTDRGEG